ncbi:hypothetical protein PMZ80_008165 [Knufia obscura]|uniref:Uncharacterized protein n=2 Tax=Knufia TaxID=430999 RepID=A0AAN8EJX7_9EURO|nr:hypothetical protein PMZ80_008165 [Knufia obscura]KAK5957108.1 hypothetical protein OHC33_001477 [Knufia fluminis]
MKPSTPLDRAHHDAILVPFRLLDLPQELQDRIYEQYFQSTGLRAFRKSQDEWWDNPSPSDHVNFEGIQGLALERASSKVAADSRRARRKTWPRTLDVDVSCALYGGDFDALCYARYAWLQEHIERINMTMPAIGGRDQSWSMWLASFAHLRDIAVVDQSHVRSPYATYERDIYYEFGEGITRVVAATSNDEEVNVALQGLIVEK